MEALSPQFFDALVIVNLVLGMIWAGRRFWRDMREESPSPQ